MFKKSPLFIPFFACFPAISLMGQNTNQTTIDNLIRPIIFSILLAILIFSFLYLVTQDLSLASLTSALLLFIFFFYGHTFALIEEYEPYGMNLSRNSILTFFFAVIFIIVFIILIQRKRELVSIFPLVNVISIAILIFPLFQIGRYYYENYLNEMKVLFRVKKTGIF